MMNKTSAGTRFIASEPGTTFAPASLYLLLSLLFFLSPLAFALDPDKKITQYIHDSWGLEHNLPQISVYTIIQSRDGYLWLGTQEGLARFDGVNFTVYDRRNTDQLLSAQIRVLYQDRDGDIWIGTYGGGLSRMTETDGNVVTYTTDHGLSSNWIYSIYEDRRGDLWLGTENGLTRTSRGDSEVLQFTVYTTEDGLTDPVVRAVCEDREGDLWIATDNGLNRLKNGRFTTFTTEDGLAGNRVWAVYEDRNRDLWVGTSGDGLNRLRRREDGGLKISVYEALEGLTNDYVRDILEDRDGNLWFATNLSGLKRLSPPGTADGKRTITALTEKQALGSSGVWCLWEDREGSLWFGSGGAGLNRLKEGKFTPYTTLDGLSRDMVLCILEDRNGYDGALWAGTISGGLNRMKDKTFTHYSTAQGLSNDRVWAVRRDRKGDLWIGTEGGLNRMRHRGTGNPAITVFTTDDGLNSLYVKVIHEDRDGNLWLGTDRGLNRLVSNGETVYVLNSFTKKQGLSHDVINCIHQDQQGYLWIGTDKGLNNIHYNDKEDTFTLHAVKEKLFNDMISCFHEERDGNGAGEAVLWIGTKSGGLIRLKNGTFTRITTEHGLFNDTIHTILEDDKKNFWITCNMGIFRVSRQELNEFCDGKRRSVRCISYDEKDGMATRECNGSGDPSGWRSSDGNFWFPTIKGIVKIDPNNIKTNLLPPPVKVEHIAADGKIMQPSTTLDKGKPVLAPGVEQVDIHYTALSMLVPERVLFRYKLEGYDTHWRDAGTRRTAYYAKLPPGNYTFRVNACNNDGVWSETGASLSFYLEPYFYQTWWFYVLCALAGLFTAFVMYRLRVRKLTKYKQDLERLVEERTHQLEEFNKELEKLSIVARETDNSVTIMDADGNFEWLNEGSTRMYGYTIVQLLEEKGANIVDISTHPDIKELLANFKKEKKSIRYESQYKTRSGKVIWTQTTWTPILDEKGNLVKIASIGSDITLLKESEIKIRKQNEEILKQSQELQKAIEIARRERTAANEANRAKGEFLARMSHEIRTPMNGIIGFTDMLLDTQLNLEQLDYALTISRSSDALTVLLNDILDFSRIEAGELVMTPIDFDPELTAFDVFEIVRPRLGDKPVEMLCRIGDNVPAYVKADAGRFRQVLINLLGNAAKFTEKGEIELSLQVEERQKTRIKYHITIRDTGIGIPREKLESVFNVFQQVDGSDTRKYEGSGLGLAIAKQIAQLMGGDVWAESKPGEGSVFHFTAWMDKSKKRPKKELIPEHLEGKTALVVTGNPGMREIMTHDLERSHMRVVHLGEEENMVSFIRERAAAGEFVDICIIDIHESRIEGYDVVKEIRDLDPPMSSLPLLAFSSPVPDRPRILKEAGFDGFLSKPVRGKKLVEMVARLLAKKEDNGERFREEPIVTQHSMAEEAKHSVHILLVEDNPINRKLAQFMLTKAGYRLATANNGKEAVDMVSAEPGKFDLIFMDIQMPIMNGIDAVKEIRRIEERWTTDEGRGTNRNRVPIVAVTAQSMKGDREKCIDAGMDDYIAKPIKREVVFEMVKKWVFT
jgi:PAS domain S-box-containing protein